VFFPTWEKARSRRETRSTGAAVGLLVFFAREKRQRGILIETRPTLGNDLTVAVPCWTWETATSPRVRAAIAPLIGTSPVVFR
jgi:hypothetical protein